MKNEKIYRSSNEERTLMRKVSVERPIKIAAQQGERVIKTLCPMCATHCGINVRVSGNTIVNIEPMEEHPLRRLCIKSRAIPDLQYSNQRLSYPLKRVNGDWKRISWDEALNTIASKLNNIKEQYGPQALTIFFGHGIFNKETIGLVRLFADTYGTPNICSAGPLCENPRAVASLVTYGCECFHDIGRAKCILEWGVDSWNSMTAARYLYSEKLMQEKDQKIIVVDPRVVNAARKATIHLQLRPGTDLALLLAFLNVIIVEDLYDHNFVDKWTVGFDKLVEAVKDYTPKWAAGVAGVPVDKIEEAAKMYATIKPASLNTFVALQQSSNAFQSLRAMAILMSITGNVAVEGGNKPLVHPPKFLSWPFQDAEYEPKTETFSQNRFPLHDKVMKEANTNCLWDTIISREPYPIKALIIDAGNPIVTLTNANKGREAIKKLDLCVVMDLFMTETAELADIVLPAASPFEYRWSHAYLWAGLPLASMAQQVFEPLGECQGDSDFWIQLGKKMDHEDAFPWADVNEMLEETLLKPYGKTLDWMEKNPRGFFYAQKEVKFYEQKGFSTPSGKVEIYSETLEKMGLPPLPVPYEEPLESPISTPKLFEEYPLMAITGKRVEEYEHSCWRNLPTLRRRRSLPEVELNVQDAKRYGIDDGEWVTIESPKGKVTMKAKVSEDILQGVIALPHGWSRDYNVNQLTNDELLDALSGGVMARAIACKIAKA